MTFIELVNAVSRLTGKKKSDVKHILFTATQQIDSWVRVDEVRVKIPGFGRFDPRKTRGGVAFGRKLKPRNSIKFTSYLEGAPQMIEKLGVVLDDSMTKTGAVGSLCPKCGGKLEIPNKCNFCGTEPFEKKPEDKPKK